MKIRFIQKIAVSFFIASLVGLPLGTQPVELEALAPALAQQTELLQQVTIYRDTYGVPHVFGETEEAAFFGNGYAQAQERLQELVWTVLSARGRLSEVFGEGYLERDYRSRLFRIYPVAEERYPTLPPEVRRAIEAFVQGINYYIEEHRAELPAWTPALTPVDIVALYRLSVLNLALKGSGLEASNSWVLSPEKTASGRVVLVADPHGRWSQRREIHIKGGDLNVAGDLMHMLVWIGHNGYVAWGGSANRPDLVDVYEEKLNPQNPYEYLYEGEWRPLRVIKEKIPVRRGSRVVEVERELLYTHHGPIIELDRARNRAYAVKTPFFESVGMVTAHYRVAKAKSIEELKAAMASLELPGAPNVVAGDRKGNIFYVYYGKVPIRSPNYDWTKPVPGWTRETEWQGFIPFEELPQVENPPSGFLQTSNEAPWLVTPDSGLSEDPEDYPEYLVPRRLGPTQRGRRLTELLTSKEKFDREELKKFAFDTYIGLAAPLKELIFAGYEKHKDELGPLAEPVARAVELLREWDDVSCKESTAMTLFKVWYKHYRELGGSIAVGGRKEPTPEERRRAFQALKEAVEFMLAQYGTVEVPWGEVHVLQRGERLYPMGAADWEFQTVHMASATAIGSGEEHYEDGIWFTHSGSSYMFLVELGDPVRAWSVKPFGQSGDPASPHFADQTELFSRREMKPLWFSEEEVLSHLESAWGMRIQLGTRGLGYEAQLRFERPREVHPRLLEEAPAPLPEGWRATGPFLSLEPAGTPVRGELKFYLPADVSTGDVAVFRLGDRGWQRVDSQRRGDAIWAEIEMLGIYAALAQEEASAVGEPQVPTTEEIFGWVQDLWRIGAEGRYGYRMPGTPADHRAADYIEEKFWEFGLQTHKEAVSAPVSFPERWSLTVRIGDQEESIPSHFVRYAGFTPPEGLVAEMVYVGEGSEAEFAAKDASVGIEGKIVVVDVIAPGWPMSTFLRDALFVYDPEGTFADDKATENWPPVNLDESYALAKRYGAAGYVGILTFTAEYNSQFLHWYADGAMPMLFVSPEGGARLKELLAAGPVQAKMVLTGTAGEGLIYNVFGVLPGQSEEVIVVHTHYDGWATNEASGTAVVMALAKYFAQLPQESRQRTLLFVAFASHFGKKPWGGPGGPWGAYRGFLYEQLPQMVAAVNIEMIGKQFKVIEGKYVETGRIAPVHFGVRGGDILLSFVKEAIIKHDLRRSVVTPRFFGEGGRYARSGIPTIERISHNAPQFTNDDTPATVMVEALAPTVAAFIDVINKLSTAPTGMLE